jgi:hypothetical protein
MQLYRQYGYQNSSVFHGTNGGQNLLYLTDNNLNTELKCHSEAKTLRNPHQIQMGTGSQRNRRK